jgi:hypothetical protein
MKGQTRAGWEETQRMVEKMEKRVRGLRSAFGVKDFVVFPILQVGVWALRKDKNRS